jgi:hypothetical protein
MTALIKVQGHTIGYSFKGECHETVWFTLFFNSFN